MVPQLPQPAVVPGAQVPWPVHNDGSVGQWQSAPHVFVPQLPHAPSAPGTHSPAFWHTPDHWQSVPHVSVPQLPMPQGRVDPAEQAPSPEHTPLQPQLEPLLPHVSVLHRPHVRVAPAEHAESPAHGPQAQVGEQVMRPQLPQAAESPGLHAPWPWHVACQ